MTEKVNCPVDGCDYGPMPAKSVCAHYSGKGDEDHSGGYERAKSLLESESGTTAETQPDSKPAQTDTEPRESKSSTSAGDDPAKGGPSPEDRSTQSSGTTQELPCGCEKFDVSQVPEGHGEFVVTCDTCGESFRGER